MSQTVLAVVLVEHIVLLAKLAIRVIIPDEPSRLEDDEFKELYFRKKEEAGTLRALS
eukprot:COSAG01_NODE_5221_length_4404_cov_2.044599_6_plen_57_part_00